LSGACVSAEAHLFSKNGEFFPPPEGRGLV